MGSLGIGGKDGLDDLLRFEACGVHPVHREQRVGGGDPLCGVLTEGVPSGGRLVPLGKAAQTLLLRAEQLVGDGLGEVRRQCDAEARSEGLVVGQAPGKVALHDDRDVGGEVALYLIDGGEECGEVEAHPGLDVVPQVDLAPQGLVEERHGGDEDGLAGCGEHRCNGRLASAAEPFDALEQRAVRHGRTPRPAQQG